MCGRYLRRSDKQRIAEALKVASDLSELVLPEWDYNVAPTTFQPVVRESHETGERELVLMRWGLVPWFAKSVKDFGFNTINAKAEGLAESRLWKGPLERHRCLVPADGFYEWKRLEPPEDEVVAAEEATATLFGQAAAAPAARKKAARKKATVEKQPYAFTLRSGAPFAFAGLWDRWRDPAARDQVLESFTIITTDPNEVTAPVHTRMPAILRPEDYGAWLHAEPGLRAPVELLRAYPAEEMVAAPAHKDVGYVKNNHPGLVVANSL